MKKMLFLLSFGLATTFSSFHSFAGQDDNYTECSGCSVSQQSEAITSWGLQNISDEYAEIGRPKPLHLLDYERGTVSSNLLFKRQKKVWGKWAYSIEKLPIQTPTELKEKVKEVKTALDSLQVASKSITIPESVIDDPWKLVGCSYCVNDIQDFYNSTFRSEITMLAQVIADVGRTFNVANTLETRITLKFANGGQITFTTRAYTNEADVAIDKVVSVTDEANNRVPLTSAEANGQAIRIINSSRGQTISDFLNIWNLGLPRGAVGRVVVIECPRQATTPCY